MAAGLWSGEFTGTSGANGLGHAAIDSNVPKAEADLNGVGWAFYNGTTVYGTYPFAKTGLMLGKEAGGNTGLWGDAMLPIDAQSIDTKFDDGLSLSTSQMFCGSVSSNVATSEICRVCQPFG